MKSRTSKAPQSTKKTSSTATSFFQPSALQDRAARWFEHQQHRLTIHTADQHQCLWLLVALSINLMLFGLTYLLYTPQFNTGDDAAMMLIASGKVITPEASEYLIFTNVLLGHLLKHLYALLPEVPWYAWYLVATLFAAHVGLLWVLLARTRSWIVLGVYGLYFLVFGVYMLLSLQFTMAATMAAFAGTALIVFMPPKASASPSDSLFKHFTALPTLTVVVGVGLLVWSALVRWQSFGLVGLCVLPVVMLRIFRLSRAERPSALLRGAVLVGAALLAMAAESYNHWRYDHWGTMNYVKFNRTCAEFLDYRTLYKVAPEQALNAFGQAGWTPNDYGMFANYFYMNEQLYNLQTFSQVLSALAGTEQRVNVGDVAQRQWNSLTEGQAKCAFALGLLVAFGLLEKRNSIVLLATGVLTVIILSTGINYATVLRPSVERVTLPLVAWMVLLALLLVSEEHLHTLPRRLRSRVATLGLLAALAASIWGAVNGLRLAHDVSQESERKHAEFRSLVAALNPNPRHLYVIWADALRFEDLAPFGDLHFLDNLHGFWLSWYERSPASLAQLGRFGIADLYTALATREDVWMLMSEAQNAIGYAAYYRIYMQEHYGRATEPRGGRAKLLNPPVAAQVPSSTRCLLLQFAFTQFPEAPQSR
jgi:hypothetical protein